MKNKFVYNGSVTLWADINGKPLLKKYFNNGTPLLFKVYAMLLSGMLLPKDSDLLLPSMIDIVDSNGKSILRKPPTGLRQFVEVDNTPITRITVSLTREMIIVGDDPGNISLLLLNRNTNNSIADRTLARIQLENDTSGLLAIIQSMTPGTQLIINWDLKVDNEVKK